MEDDDISHSDEFKVTKLWRQVHRYPGPDWKLAARCDFSPTTLSLYINGRQPITPKHLVALCVELDCNPEDIIGWVDDITTPAQLEDTLSATG